MRVHLRGARGGAVAAWAWSVSVALAGAAAGQTIPTTVNNFVLGGTQPGALAEPIVSAEVCFNCHADFDHKTEPGRLWASSTMAQAARDPVFLASLDVANADLGASGDLCLRCHAPSGWLQQRATPPDGSALTTIDRQGVSCNICHRLVDPVAHEGNPGVDAEILASLTLPPADPHSANYVIDPQDRRRAPFDLGASFSYHPMG